MNLDVDWIDITKRLLPVARDTLARYAPPERRQSDKLPESYVVRAVERFLADDADVADTFVAVATIVVHLIEEDERKLDEIIAATNWDDVTRRVLAYTAGKHGAAPTRSGKDPSDRLNEAVVMLLERRRHFPHYRPGMSLVGFLCATIDSIVSHDAEKLKNHGADIPEATERLPETSQQPRDVINDLEDERFIASLPPELQDYVRLRVREPNWTAKEYAAHLKVTVARIHDWNRKIKRRRRSFE